MPKIVDRDARRDEILSATWRVIVRDGTAGAAVRAVAREARCPPGILAHRLDGKAGITGAALVPAHRRAAARMDAKTAGRAGLDALRPVTPGALPPDDERDLQARAEISFRGRAPGGPELRQAQNAESGRLGARLRRHRAEARGQGGLPDSADIDLAARRLLVLTGGLSAERVPHRPLTDW